MTIQYGACACMLDNQDYRLAFVILYVILRFFTATMVSRTHLKGCRSRFLLEFGCSMWVFSLEHTQYLRLN